MFTSYMKTYDSIIKQIDLLTASQQGCWCFQVQYNTTDLEIS